MKLGVFMSDYQTGTNVVDRLKAEKLGIIFVGNGIYHTAVKEGGKASSLLDKSSNLYVLAEDLESRGFTPASVDSRVKVVSYDDVVDLIFNDYEKIIWI